MRVLHIIASLDAIGGAELMLERLAIAQQRGGEVKPMVIALQKDGPIAERLRAEGIEVQAVGLGSRRRLGSAVFRLRRLVRELQPDIVQTWMYHADLLGGLAARLAGQRRVVWGIRNTDLFPGNGASRGLAVVMRLCARLSRRVPMAIICVAEAARKSHIAFGYAPEKMHVIQNGFLPSEPSEDARETVRRDFRIPAAAVVIGSVGRFNLYKDHRTFVDAMARVAERLPEARFLMIGRGVDAGNTQLQEWVDANGYGERFVFAGERRDLPRYFAAMDLFCLHSRSEGFPNVLAEAMLAGLPIVTTDVGDARLLGGAYGEVVPAAVPQLLADATIRMVSLGPERLREIGSEARVHVQASHSLTAVTERYGQLYRSLMSTAIEAEG